MCIIFSKPDQTGALLTREPAVSGFQPHLALRTGPVRLLWWRQRQHGRPRPHLADGLWQAVPQGREDPAERRLRQRHGASPINVRADTGVCERADTEVSPYVCELMRQRRLFGCLLPYFATSFAAADFRAFCASLIGEWHRYNGWRNTPRWSRNVSHLSRWLHG